jgi:hypothetical protein
MVEKEEFRTKLAIAEFFEKLEREGKEICDFDRIVGKDPVTNEDIEMIVIKTK